MQKTNCLFWSIYILNSAKHNTSAYVETGANSYLQPGLPGNKIMDYFKKNRMQMAELVCIGEI